MLIFLKWVNRTFQILEPIMHLCVFPTEKWAEEKPIFIILALCIIWLCVQWDHFERLSDLEIYKMFFVSCPIQFFSQERTLKTLPMLAIVISGQWSHLVNLHGGKGKREIGVVCTESNDGHRGKICDSCPYGIFSKIL